MQNGNGHLMGPGEETDTPVIPTISLDKAPRVFGGHYYSDNEGNWYYKDTNGKTSSVSTSLTTFQSTLTRMANKSKDVLQRMVAITIKTLVHL